MEEKTRVGRRWLSNGAGANSGVGYAHARNSAAKPLPRASRFATADSRLARAIFPVLANGTTLWFVPPDLKILLSGIVFIGFGAWLPRAIADEWISEKYRCALTIPTQESWTPALIQQLPSGEMIFHAASMTSRQGISISYVPDISFRDINNPTLVKHIQKLLEAQGWAVGSATQLVWNGRPFVQFISRRRDLVEGKILGITRVTLRQSSLYVITAYGKGEANRAEDPEFMRVMETFRLLEGSSAIVNHAEGPLLKQYQLAMLGTVGAAVLLIGAFFAVVIHVRRTAADRA